MNARVIKNVFRSLMAVVQLNTRRKVQLAAALVILNGTLALEVLSPRSAAAASCPPQYVPISPCNRLAAMNICPNQPPPGCTWYGAWRCVSPSILECFYA